MYKHTQALQRKLEKERLRRKLAREKEFNRQDREKNLSIDTSKQLLTDIAGQSHVLVEMAQEPINSPGTILAQESHSELGVRPEDMSPTLSGHELQGINKSSRCIDCQRMENSVIGRAITLENSPVRRQKLQNSPPRLKFAPRQKLNTDSSPAFCSPQRKF